MVKRTEASDQKRPSRKITIKSPIPAMLAANMEMPTPPPASAPPSLYGLFDDASSPARKRVNELVESARAELDGGNAEGAAELVELALLEAEKAPPPGIDEVIEPARPLLEQVFLVHVGGGERVPIVEQTPGAMAGMALDHRTGFMLSQIDGSMTIDELLEISGMSKLDTLRILSSLVRLGVVEFR